MDFRVVVHNDALNTFALIVDVLNRVCALPPADAVTVARQIHNEGRATVGLAMTRADAEAMVARVQGFGLLAMIERNAV
jgi:ATP-dependent Clp protease adapter protein ClpS